MTLCHEVPTKGPTDRFEPLLAAPRQDRENSGRCVFLAKNNVRQTVEMDEAPGSVKSALEFWRAPGFVGLECDFCQELCPKLMWSCCTDRAYRERCEQIDRWNKHLDAVHNPHKKKRHGNGVHNGAFAFTLTKSPKDPLTIGDMLAAVRKVMSQKSCPVIKYAWYYEDKGRDENGDAIHPHIHGMYETASGGRIERKHWVRAWSIWGEGDPKRQLGAGFTGGYHRPVKNDEKYANYISKDGGMSESLGLTDEQSE